jgi:hypothetical protein
MVEKEAYILKINITKNLSRESIVMEMYSNLKRTTATEHLCISLTTHSEFFFICFI